MTNNPTIDGVSRELLPCPFCGGDAVLKQYRADGLEIRCTGCQSMRQQRWMGKGRGWLETKMIEKWNERAIQTAERQEPVVLLSEHKKGLDAYLEQIKGQQSTIALLEARITQLESEKEFAAATYQAARDRIAELESVRGEPILQIEYMHDPGWRDTDLHQFNVASKLKGYRTRTVFNAPPAPVGHTMKSVMSAVCAITGFPTLTSNQCHALAQSLNACLDATAALNGLKS